MPKILLFSTILLVSLVSTDIIPSNVIIQPLTITANFNVQPAPVIQTPPIFNYNLSYSQDNPCGSKSYCGQAANFKSKAELQNFTDKNCPPILYYPMFKTSDTQASASNDFSGTNNQQTNVDEADILKTDGEYIYTVSGNILSIVKAYPSNQTKIVSTLSFSSSPASIFLEGNYLAIFGTDYEESDNGNSPNPLPLNAQSKIAGGFYYYSRPYTWVYVYDVSKKASPKLVKDYKVAGYYFDGRKSSTGFVYILSQLNCNGMDGLTPWYNFGQGRKNMTLQQVFYYPESDYQGANFVNIFAFDLKKPLGCNENVISVLTLNTYVLYMSQKYIYLTSTQWLADAQSTKIHKIYVSKTQIIPMADGNVSGYVNDQFSLDQYNGTLRIATTQTGITGIPSNNVFCLDSSLKTIGTLRNIAINETIFSARYMEKRLYLVTFRRIDPFFVIDLSNPKSPAVLGELKISGFSNYLHPYDNNTVIGFGQQTNPQGQQTGLKVSLFDVKNVTNPQSIADFVLQQQYVYSAAQWEHKAFLFSKQKNLMVVPASYYDWQNTANNANSYNGALVFYIKRDINGGSIQLRGIVNHMLAADDQFWDRQVQRSLYIQDLLYTKSRCLLRIHSLSQLSAVVNLKLNCDYDPIIQPRLVSKPVFNPLQPTQVSGPIPVV